MFQIPTSQHQKSRGKKPRGSKLPKRVCLCGSFRFFDELARLESFLVDEGAACYAPEPFHFRDKRCPSRYGSSWHALSYKEKLVESKQAESAFLGKIDKADVLYVVNPTGYVGMSVVFEIGYAYAKRKKIYVQEPIEDHTIMSMVDKVLRPEDLLKSLDINNRC